MHMSTTKKHTTKPARAARVKKVEAIQEELSTAPKLPSLSSIVKGNNFLVALLVVLAFVAGYLFFKVQSLEQTKTTANVTTTQPDTQQPSKPTVTIDKIKGLFASGFAKTGDANKKVLFVEISDPSCPFCHFAAGKNPELSKESGRFQYVTDGGTYTPPVTEMKKLVDEGKASFVWLYSNGHGNGELGAQALYCAYEKGKFWEAHDLLMSNSGYDLLNTKMKNDKANIPLLVDFLSPQVDATFMKSCLESGKYADTLKRDQQLATALGFQGTPDFFVNTTNFGGAVDYKNMDATVQDALK